MNVIKPILVLVFVFFGVTFQVKAQTEHWIINTLEWPPYTCSRCAENGAAAKALRDSLKTVGVEVEFVFYTWSQTIKKAAEPKVFGYFPMWYDTLKPGFIRSPALFSSPIGIIQQRKKPLVWNNLSDLKGKKIGVTQDYNYSEEFNRLVKSGAIKVETAISDDINLTRVASGELDGAMTDINNARYFLFNSSAEVFTKVEVNPKILETKELFIGINEKSAGKIDKLKQALKNVNYQRLVDEYLLRYQRRVE
ncbi:ABC transporter substrate-binding protein [Bdellovibrio sp. NC01]|uniref:substrate-binding periplasmic protein n=1 Tax=Bdellovibrio sp. NC01 TaxID=2220073 RepID=UPI0011571CC5|nr:transporter substrate-binding domain-containing protein [Bdellovibrio sp. NC01]QDK36635.1 ABC transporter substrate-binding protein [Bdellovibrio sp. NC01]